MSEYGPTLSERAVRQLGVDVANIYIDLAMQKGRLESLAELASEIDFNQWKTPPKVEVEDEDSAPPPEAVSTLWSVPPYQVNAVMMLVAAFTQ